MFYFDLSQWIIVTFFLLILGHILYPVVCEILFSNLYLDLIEFEINYNYNYNNLSIATLYEIENNHYKSANCRMRNDFSHLYKRMGKIMF
jgi:ABC-type bacteriocin/lantibiotic exporter with double-glycine peptidase domain